MLKTFKWCVGRFVIFSPDLMWASVVFGAVEQILSPKTSLNAFESEFLNGLELWSLVLSRWCFYILKWIPLKAVWALQSNISKSCCFSIPCCKLGDSSPKLIQLGTWRWFLVEEKIKQQQKPLQTNKIPTAGSKGSGFVHLLLLWQKWPSEIGLCALLETPCIIFNRFLLCISSF